LANKAIVLLLLLFFSIVGSVAIVAAQNSTNSLIALSSTEINFYGEEGSIPSYKSITVVGLADGVDVKLVPSNLHLNGSGEDIPVKLNDAVPLSSYSFSLSKNEERTVEVSLGSADEPGIYRGTIIVTAKIGTGNATT
jgi:hypothetical protein